MDLNEVIWLSSLTYLSSPINMWMLVESRELKIKDKRDLKSENYTQILHSH